MPEEVLTKNPDGGPAPPPINYKKFSNPYPDPDHSCERIQLWVGRDDVTFIRLIRPQIGTFAAVGGHLWQKLCEALRLRGINDFTQSTEFEHFLVNCTIIHKDEYDSLKRDAAEWQRFNAGNLSQPGGPSNRAESDTNEGNVRKGAKRVRKLSTNEPKVSPDIPGDNLGGEERKGS